MRASTVTKLSLYDWAKIMGIHPLHFGQVQYTPPNRSVTLCDQVYVQYAWQDSDKVAREDIARAIAEAEELIERYLKFRLAPAWEVDEWRPTEASISPELFRVGLRDIRSLQQIVKANWGWFIVGGVKTKTLLDNLSPVVYTDEDDDDYDETATVTAVVPEGTLPCEVVVYYPNKSAADEWEVRPTTVTVTGTTATIIFRREQAVIEPLMEATFVEAVDGSVDANFLGEVDVYRLWNDPQTQATIMWEPGSTCGCGTEGCPTCTYSVQSACLHLRGDPKLSLLAYTPGDWNADDNSFDSVALFNNRQPDLVRLYYQAGLRDKRKACVRDMDDQWKRTVAHYAAALLDRPPCDCTLAEWEYWREDLSLVQGSDGTGNQKGIYQPATEDLDNPFGMRRGMLDAWRRVKHQGMAGAVLV